MNAAPVDRPPLLLTATPATETTYMTAVSLLAALLVAVLACAAHAAPTDAHAVARYSFEEYLAEFGKAYPRPEEYASRRALFEASKARIVAHNRQPQSYLMGFNEFTDLTEEEVRPYYSGVVLTEGTRRPTRSGILKQRSSVALPASFTWQARTPAVLTPVKLQGSCGSCWAHAAVECVESQLALLTKTPAIPLSVQQVTSCTTNPRHCGGSGGCNGATAQLGWEYVGNSTGLVSEQDYPYASLTADSATVCNIPSSAKPVATVTGYVQLNHNDPQAIMEALVEKGPLAVSVDASDWKQYRQGIFDGCRQPGDHITINHGVQLVGYGTDDASQKPYWIVRNSWGAEWGEDGYIRLPRAASGTNESCHYVDDWVEVGGGCEGDKDDPITACGACGIMYDVSYPLVN